MIKFIDMTPTLRAVDPQAPPTCAFLNTETGRFCEHGGSGEHLFTSADDIAQHGPPTRAEMPGMFFPPTVSLQWADVPAMSLVQCIDDSNIAFKHANGDLEWVRLGGHDKLCRLWWSLRSPDCSYEHASEYVFRWAVVATGLRGDESVEQLQTLVGASP